MGVFKVYDEWKRRMEEAAMLERHIMQAQARAMSADERDLHRSSRSCNQYDELGLPPGGYILLTDLRFCWSVCYFQVCITHCKLGCVCVFGKCCNCILLSCMLSVCPPVYLSPISLSVCFYLSVFLSSLPLPLSPPSVFPSPSSLSLHTLFVSFPCNLPMIVFLMIGCVSFTGRAHFKSCIDTQLLREHHLLTPEDYSTEEPAVVPPPSGETPRLKKQLLTTPAISLGSVLSQFVLSEKFTSIFKSRHLKKKKLKAFSCVIKEWECLLFPPLQRILLFSWLARLHHNILYLTIDWFMLRSFGELFTISFAATCMSKVCLCHILILSYAKLSFHNAGVTYRDVIPASFTLTFMLFSLAWQHWSECFGFNKPSYYLCKTQQT